MHAIERSWVVGRFNLEAPLPDQGKVKVHRAVESPSGRRVIVRFLPDDDEAQRADLVRAQQALEALPHAAVLPILEVGVHQGRTYWVTPIIEAQTLDQLFSAGIPVPLPASLKLLAVLGDALEHLHRQGVFHGGLRPSSVLLLPDGRAMLADVGYGQLLDAFPRPPPSPAGDLEALAVLNQLLMMRRVSSPPPAPSVPPPIAAAPSTPPAPMAAAPAPTPSVPPAPMAAAPTVSAPPAPAAPAAPTPSHRPPASEAPTILAPVLALPVIQRPAPAAAPALVPAPPPSMKPEAPSVPPALPNARTQLIPFAGPPVGLGPENRASGDTLPMPLSQLRSKAPEELGPDMSAYVPSYVRIARQSVAVLKEKAGPALEKLKPLQARASLLLAPGPTVEGEDGDIERLAGIGWMSLSAKDRLKIFAAAGAGLLFVIWLASGSSPKVRPMDEIPAARVNAVAATAPTAPAEPRLDLKPSNPTPVTKGKKR